MKLSTSIKSGYEKKEIAKPFVTIVRCVNCNAVGNCEDIEFGCARCIANDFGMEHPTTYTRKDWFKEFPEGGWHNFSQLYSTLLL